MLLTGRSCVVDVGAVVDADHLHGPGGLVDAVHHAVGAAADRLIAGQLPSQRPPNHMWPVEQSADQELAHRSRHATGRPWRSRSSVSGMTCPSCGQRSLRLMFVVNWQTQIRALASSGVSHGRQDTGGSDERGSPPHLCLGPDAWVANGHIPVAYSARFREFSIVISEAVGMVINYYPSCWARLPNSLRDELFDRLFAMGMTGLNKCTTFVVMRAPPAHNCRTVAMILRGGGRSVSVR
jgi:hypothetical protein